VGVAGLGVEDGIISLKATHDIAMGAISEGSTYSSYDWRQRCTTCRVRWLGNVRGTTESAELNLARTRFQEIRNKKK